MMSYTFSEVLERADNVSGIYFLVTHKKKRERGKKKKHKDLRDWEGNVHVHMLNSSHACTTVSYFGAEQPVVALC